MDASEDTANALALNRVAIGFPAATIGAVRWPDYGAYSTAEGRELNETAREVGDDPDDWWVSEQPVDLLLETEFWAPPLS